MLRSWRSSDHTDFDEIAVRVVEIGERLAGTVFPAPLKAPARLLDLGNDLVEILVAAKGEAKMRDAAATDGFAIGSSAKRDDVVGARRADEFHVFAAVEAFLQTERFLVEAKRE